MAGGEPAGFGYWIGVLVESCGLAFKEEVPKEKRGIFRRLVRFLIANEFDNVKQLRGGAYSFSNLVHPLKSVIAGKDPSLWPGAGEFLQSELDLLRPLVRGGRSRSPVRQQRVRCAVPFGHGVHLFVHRCRCAAQTKVDVQQILSKSMPTTSHAVGHGPKAALRVWQCSRMNVAETVAWLEEARLESILGSCRRSLPSVR